MFWAEYHRAGAQRVYGGAGKKVAASIQGCWVRSKKNTSQALAEMREKLVDSADVREMIEFAEKAERGIVK